ncbi:Retrovirus-related Pol polyprotein from transposon 17.6 [Frankliniella fusca]|uniref:Retrovirus-related Pol polyprotein from transposon 17.6 n=1 Tax=Frankliniella fusca TaxID=407009 RepID=A0AAE1HC86_9NEOP|nr:Retrovirus-related Pol polyprotein from transposon 17.6 [Frankliniella fusca]
MESVKPLVPGEDLEAQWKFLKWQFDGYVLFDAARATWSTENKAKALMHFIGLECAYLNETVLPATKKDHVALIAHIDEQVKPDTNACFERFQFKKLVRKPGEDINHCVSRCAKLASCGIPAGFSPDFMIMDALMRQQGRLVADQDQVPPQDQWREGRDQDHLHEAEANPGKPSRSNQRRSRSRSKSGDRNARCYRARSPTPGASRVSTDDESDCQNCGYSHGSDWCPARDKKCHSCGHLGHFAYKCQSRTFSIDPDQLSPKMWAEYIEFEFGLVQIKLDTGAEVYCGARLRPLGSTIFENCKLNKISLALEFIVAEVESVPLLSLEACEQYKLINRVINKSIKHISNVFKVSINACETAMLKNNSKAKQPKVTLNQIPKITSVEDSLEKDSARRQVILDNPDVVFTKKPGCFPNLYSIEVDHSKKPVAVPSRRVPLAIKDRYRAYLQKLCSQEIIKKCTNPRGYISPVVIVEKPDGSLRICLDPKHLNEALCRPFYQIPSIEDISALLTNKKHFTVLDLTSGFWHCKLADSSSELCKFSTPFGIYQFLRLPFGLSVSPEIFQQAVNDVFGNIDDIILYFDDSLIVSDSEEKHDLIFKAIIQRARENNVHLNPEKIQYKKTSVKFLGHIFSQWGKSVDPDGIEAITNLKNPTNVKELQRLLGIVNHLREFVPNLAEDTACLTQSMKKNVHFEWLPFHSDALDSIKDKICLNISLVVFDPNKSIEIQCDASQNSLGTCLMQNGRPVSLASRSLTQSERNYAQIEKELLAIVYSVSWQAKAQTKVTCTVLSQQGNLGRFLGLRPTLRDFRMCSSPSNLLGDVLPESLPVPLVGLLQGTLGVLTLLAAVIAVACLPPSQPAPTATTCTAVVAVTTSSGDILRGKFLCQGSSASSGS